MDAFELTLRRREEIAESTMAFYFDKPADLQFKAGQTLDFTLPNPPETDADGNTRTFSIASAPEDGELVIATRIRGSAFKRVLSKAPIGSNVVALGPYGSFTLHNDASKPAVFLTGGIGITPFRSIIRDAAARKLGHTMWLFYSNNTPETTAFLDEFQQLSTGMPSFHFVPTMTAMGKSKRQWSGETRLIDREMIGSRLPLQGPRYYIAGPPGMVAAMREMLVKAGVDEDEIRSEDFPGY